VTTENTRQAFGTPRIGMQVYSTACASVIALLFLTNWPGYQYSVRGGPIPLYFYLLPAGLILPMIFAAPHLAVRSMRDPVFWWFLMFVLTGLVWLLPAQDFVDEASRQWRLRVLSFIGFYSVALLISEAHRRALGWVIVVCVLMACAFNWFDVLRPYRFVPQGIEGASDGRGAGLFINPNAAASFVVMGTIAALPMIPVRLRGILLVTAVFGVAATFSRGGFVLIGVALLGAIGLKLVSRTQRVLLIIALPLLIGGVSLSYDYLVDASDNRQMQNIVQRLAWFQEMDEEDGAVEGRKHGASQAWQLFLESPVIGKGVGVTSLAVRQEGPHNMYLALMAEQGLLGLFLYVSLVGILLRRGWRLARHAATDHDRDVGRTLVIFGMFIAAYGFFSHNVLEEPHTIFILAFLVAAGFHGALTSGERNVPVRRERAVGMRVGSSA
jgi:O-antigen ligase